MKLLKHNKMNPLFLKKERLTCFQPFFGDDDPLSITSMGAMDGISNAAGMECKCSAAQIRRVPSHENLEIKSLFRRGNTKVPMAEPVVAIPIAIALYFEKNIPRMTTDPIYDIPNPMPENKSNVTGLYV